MNKKIFVDEKHNVFIDRDAQRKLLEDSDKHYLEDVDRGITQVPLDRWKIAQRYERKTWMEIGLTATSDRNLDYVLAFNKYVDLKRHEFEDAIELGCGPFTNLRLIAWACHIKRCTLLDPLIGEYLSHPNCYYSCDFLFRDPRFFVPNFANSRLGRRIYKMLVPKKIYGGIPIEQMISKPIEGMSGEFSYDLIVMINVLEHCYNMNLIFEKLTAVARTGACLIFRDKYYSDAKIASDVDRVYDAGHPLRFNRRVVDNFLNERFSPVFRTVQKVKFSVGGVDRSYDAINFIGRFEG